MVCGLVAGTVLAWSGCGSIDSTTAVTPVAVDDARLDVARDVRPRCSIEPPSAHYLLGMLRAERTDELTAWFEALHRRYANEVSCDYVLILAFDRLVPAESWVTDVVDRWVSREPESWVAATARGYHFQNLAWASRGTGFIAETTEEGRRGMYEAVRVGAGELERALALEPSAVAPHPIILDMAMMVASRSVRTAVYERAAAAHPLSFQVHVKHMHDLTPKWGGSYEAMEDFAASLAPSVPHNPELGVLAAYPVRERAEAAWRRKDRAEALRLYDRAFEMGTRASWLVAAARLAYSLDRHARMLAYLDLHEERWGASPDQLYWKTKAYFLLDRVGDALRSAERGIALDPGDPRAYRQYAWALARLERWPEAASAFQQALRFDPGSRWLLQQLAWITAVELGRADEAKALYHAALAEHPDDPELVYGLGDLLADTGDPGAAEYLRRYLRMVAGETDEERRRIEWIEEYLQEQAAPPAEHRGT